MSSDASNPVNSGEVVWGDNRGYAYTKVCGRREQRCW